LCRFTVSKTKTKTLNIVLQFYDYPIAGQVGNNNIPSGHSYVRLQT